MTRFNPEESAARIDRIRQDAEDISFKARVEGVKLHDDALASQEQAVRDNAKSLGLSRRETQRRVDNVRQRFGFKAR